MRRPDFFIVGAPKCGTTAMYTYLKQHPEVFMPDKKEPNFFCTDFNSGIFVRNKEQYLSLFSDAKDKKRAGEASVWYLYSKRAASEIKEFSPSAKIIIMLRNPADMLYSQHSQFLYNGNEDIEDFEEALDAEGDRKRGLRIPRHAHFPESLFYRETAKYTEQVQRYLDIFGREDVHIIIYDDFKNDTAGVYKETLLSLGVAGDFRPEFDVINTNKRVRSERLRGLLRNPPPVARLFGRALIPRGMREELRKKVKIINTRYVSRPPMDPGLRKRLLAEFVPEIERLSRLLGRDLTYWCKAGG